jgi:2',3'-cyclic-nucleotide 2'-phosphodiesterase (5'-nucleotidase family)
MSGQGPLRRRITVVFAVAAAAAVALLPATNAAAGTPELTKYDKNRIPVQLLSFNDYHGHLEADSGSDGSVTFEGKAIPANGASYLATHLKQLRKGHPTSFTVAAGDLIGGSTFTSGVFHDEPAVETLDAMGLDVSSVGNHEFDEGVTELRRMMNGGCHPVDGCFQQDTTGKDIVFPGADYKYLGANVINTKTDKPALPRYWIKKVGPTRIGFIGMTLEGTDSLVSPAGIAGYDFTDEVKAGNMAANALNKKGVKAIVVMIHEGGLQTGSYSACTGMSGPIVDIASRLTSKVDTIITGHTHAAYVCNIKDPKGLPRMVTSAMSYGRLITETNFKINSNNGEIVRSSVSSLNHLVTRDVPQDPGVRAIVEKWVAKAAGPGNRVVGTISSDIKRSSNRGAESSLPNNIADAQKESTGAHVAFMNPGGVRADFLFNGISSGEAPGQVTYREAYNVQPFSNIMQTFSMTGAQIEQLLEQQWVRGRAGGEVLRLGISEGFTYSWSASAPFGSKVDPASIKLNGVTLDPAASYKVAANNFIADGGDSFTAFVNGAPRTGGKIDLDALIDYFAAHPGIGPAPATRSTQLP